MGTHQQYNRRRDDPAKTDERGNIPRDRNNPNNIGTLSKVTTKQNGQEYLEMRYDAFSKES